MATVSRGCLNSPISTSRNGKRAKCSTFGASSAPMRWDPAAASEVQGRYGRHYRRRPRQARRRRSKARRGTRAPWVAEASCLHAKIPPGRLEACATAAHLLRDCIRSAPS
jgi:hypothetical protein